MTILFRLHQQDVLVSLCKAAGNFCPILEQIWMKSTGFNATSQYQI